MMPEGDAFGGGERIPGTWINGVLVQPGMRVRLHPSGRSGLEEQALRGRSAAVDRIDVDFEGRVFVAVVLDQAPGAEDEGAGEPGRKRYYRADEIEPLASPEGRDP
jgi:hypothetical protein